MQRVDAVLLHDSLLAADCTDWKSYPPVYCLVNSKLSQKQVLRVKEFSKNNNHINKNKCLKKSGKMCNHWSLPGTDKSEIKNCKFLQISSSLGSKSPLAQCVTGPHKCKSAKWHVNPSNGFLHECGRQQITLYRKNV